MPSLPADGWPGTVLLSPYPPSPLLLSYFSIILFYFLLLHVRAALRSGEAVAVVTLTNWLLGLMIAATENPAQLLFGVVCVVVLVFF